MTRSHIFSLNILWFLVMQIVLCVWVLEISAATPTSLKWVKFVCGAHSSEKLHLKIQQQRVFPETVSPLLRIIQTSLWTVFVWTTFNQRWKVMVTFPQLFIVYYWTSSCNLPMAKTLSGTTAFIMKGWGNMTLFTSPCNIYPVQMQLMKPFEMSNNNAFTFILSEAIKPSTWPDINWVKWQNIYFYYLGEPPLEQFCTEDTADPISSLPWQDPHPASLFKPPSTAPASCPFSIDPGSYHHSDPCVISGA